MRCWDESVLQTHEHDLPDRRAFHQVTAGGKRGFRDVWEVFKAQGGVILVMAPRSLALPSQHFLYLHLSSLALLLGTRARSEG